MSMTIPVPIDDFRNMISRLRSIKLYNENNKEITNIVLKNYTYPNDIARINNAILKYWYRTDTLSENMHISDFIPQRTYDTYIARLLNALNSEVIAYLYNNAEKKTTTFIVRAIVTNIDILEDINVSDQSEVIIIFDYSGGSNGVI